MSKLSLKITTELNETNKRLSELFQLRESLECGIEDLQDGFTDGTIALDELQAEQSKLAIVKNSISDLLQTRMTTEQALNDALQSEARIAQIVKAKAIAPEIVEANREYAKNRTELDTAINLFGERMVNARYRLIQKQIECENLLNEIQPRIEPEELGLPNETLNIIRRNQPERLPVKFGDIIQGIERQIIQGREWKASRTKEAEKERAENNYWKTMAR